MRTLALANGETIPVLGQGTWCMAEKPRSRESEINALRRGLDLGMRLVDTAEMYADGASEELVGEALAGRRDEVFLVSKVLPQNASRRGTIAACERSLRRLGTDRLDLYLLHWRGSVPLQETVEALARLKHDGKIRHWGVSNFDLDDMRELEALAGGEPVVNQVLYNLTRRGIEYDLLPWCRSNGIAVMAYSPIEQGKLLGHPVLREVAARHDATAAQVALSWVLRQQGVVAIPKAGRAAHVEENREALELALTEADLVELDRAFRPPTSPRPLEMI
ncbi:aldo/keto reductase [Noviherbaspirillum sp.]|uniref:aldo/keto reductase n=1 Tax=Noviherbaspirillum sp. TaxID=1926288 RepID=UPI002D25088B|nr:aldo/keto reductase [Noviherbaspirillum sp.]HZW20705.1 aldo/keto reductase [Noviherbaspirillum sp.]